jgi:tetratricopeptide (TPR) repeat protein
VPEKTLKEVDRSTRDLFQRAATAIQRENWDYAITLYSQCLHNEPGFLECRTALRATQIKKFGASTGFFKKVFGTAGNSPQLAKGQMALRSSPLEALEIAEQMLNGDPHNSMGLKLSADAATAAGLHRTAVLSLEALRRATPKDRAVNLQLAKAYIDAGQPDKGDAIYSELLRANPADAEVANFYKDLSAVRTLNEKGYGALEGGQGSYRDILKDKDEAVVLEQEKRMLKAEDVAANLIVEFEARLAREPGNLKVVRDIAGLYTEMKAFDKALAFYEQIMVQEGATDATLEKAVADTRIRKLDHQLSKLDPQGPDYQEHVQRIQRERAEFQISDCQRRAEKYPTDLEVRFELGLLFYQAGKFSEAIKEFQRAQNNPHQRISAIYHLGLCFAQRGMNDLAVRSFQNAIKEKELFDDEKKELLYAYGTVLEKMGKREEAIEQFKFIYEVDSGYKDVEAKVDKYYSGQ